MLLSTPSVLAHTIYQALSFDASYVEEGFQLQGTSATSLADDESAKWDGISNVILGNQQWFQAWLSGEERCQFINSRLFMILLNYILTTVVQDQYQEIISASDAWIISDDVETSSQAISLKSTNSARRIKALFEQVTGKSLPLLASPIIDAFQTGIPLYQVPLSGFIFSQTYNCLSSSPIMIVYHPR
jgi:hypothetical protein